MLAPVTRSVSREGAPHLRGYPGSWPCTPGCALPQRNRASRDHKKADLERIWGAKNRCQATLRPFRLRRFPDDIASFTHCWSWLACRAHPAGNSSTSASSSIGNTLYISTSKTPNNCCQKIPEWKPVSEILLDQLRKASSLADENQPRDGLLLSRECFTLLFVVVEGRVVATIGTNEIVSVCLAVIRIHLVLFLHFFSSLPPFPSFPSDSWIFGCHDWLNLSAALIAAASDLAICCCMLLLLLLLPSLQQKLKFPWWLPSSLCSCATVLVPWM